ncbi:MAG: hypothetical protein Q9173_005938 [Seirophora scorigena]
MAYPPPAGGQPPSFKTNVNRAKTKRWVEAKSYTYDGDDWGEMDEYDEYGGYDEPPPPQRPTGLRQRGQSANQEQPGIYQPRQGGYNSPEASQHGYGDLGRQGPGQQQYGARSATNPPHHPHLGQSGSFDRGDERRAFSASHPSHELPPPQSGTNHPDPYGQALDNAALSHPRGAQTHLGQRTFQPAADSYDHNLRHGEFYHPPEQNISVTASDHARQPNMGSRTQSMTSQSSMEFHTRRDFSPSAVPPPLHTRASPSPHDKFESQSAMRPPRKSSLSQHVRPQHPQEDQNSGVIGQLDSEGIEPVPRSRTDSNTGKPLPFVRPADIYKRLQEEKEKERQSQDSSRPSMDAIMGDNQADDESIKIAGGTSDRSQAGDFRQRSRSAFDAVAERKGEYGTSGAPESDVNQSDEPIKQQATLVRPPKTFESDTLMTRPSPQLPDVARMSGFGELFAGPSHSPGRTTDPPVMKGKRSSQMPQDHPPETQIDSTLQHQPSLGFRSAVHQAFDSTNEPVPETPSSSNPDSSIGRSGSGGTGAVSPIISRGPSSATRNLNSRDPQIRPATPPSADQKTDSEARPESSGSLATPKAVQRKPTPDLTDQRPANFIPGHRRDLSTPSPDNSPARTPAVEVNKQTQQPQEAELAMTTPIETRFPYDHSQSESSQSSHTSPVKASDNSDFATMHPSTTGRILKEAANLSQGTSGETPKSPAESNRSRVRNLADKFESGRSSPAGPDRAPSPIKTGFLPNPSVAPSRPFASERMESFRPKLPGGWESSASLASLATHSKPEPTLAPVSLQQRLQYTTNTTAPLSNNVGNASDTYSKGASSSPATNNDVSMSDPFASLAAAGSALAGAFSTAIGSDEGNKYLPTKPTEQDGRPFDPTATEDDSKMARSRKSSNAAFIPEASQPTMLATLDDGTSSIMPTPLDKISQPAHSGESQAGDYFAAGPRSSTPKQQASGDSHTTQDSDSIQRSRLLPSISTEMAPQYESDRLRREIIRELSPGMPSEPSTAESNVQSREISRQSTALGERRDERESMVLPREYDSYWNASGSEQSSRASSVRGHPKEVKVAIPQDQKDRTTLSPLPYTASQAPGVTQPAQNRLDERPGMPSHRFSWERTKEAVPLVKAPGSSQLRSSDDKLSGPLHQPQEQEQPQEQMSEGIYANAVPQTQRVPAPEPQLRDFGAQPESMPRERSSEPEAMRYSSEQDPAAGPGERKSSVTSEHPVHLDSPQSAVRDFESPVTQPNQNPSQSHQHRHDDGQHLSQSTVPSQGTPPASALPTVHPRVQNFREILAMKNPQDRIKAFDESRQHFANIDTGLEHWLAATTTDLPEHKELLPHGKLLGPTDYKPSSTRSKLGGLLPSAGFSTQQPSYQPNLNANSPGGGINAGQAPGGSPMQGYSPTSGGSKLTSQQMQARGKDLLHSAGVFGGKANVAAKGLFSKGKSRFRGGNADKAPISSFNASHRQSLQQQHQSSESSPSTLQSASSLEQSSPKQSISSRPKSLVNPSWRGTQEQMSDGEQGQPHRSKLPVEPASDRNTGPIRPIGESGQADAEASPYLGDPSLGDTAQAQSLSTSINQAGRSGSPTLFGTHMDQRQEQYNQSRAIHSPHTPSSSNRTPTQADYADYSLRNSSPTAMRMEGGTRGNSQHASGKDGIQQQSTFQQQRNDLHPAPILQPPEEEPLASANRSKPNQGHSPVDPPRLQRGSEESDGTFRTAMSGQRRNSSIGANSSHRNTFSEPQGQPDERLTKEAPYEESHMRSPPTTSPAANIQDQPKERPFSFAKFSPSPALQPLESYSRREPSVDSTGSRIDPSQDVPPSPMSSGQSITHTQINQTDRNNASQHKTDRQMFPSNRQDSASPEYRPLSQPHQEPTIQNHPAFRQEQAPDKNDKPLEQHYPAPVSRQDPVIPRSEATEFSLQGVGPPPAPRPRTNTSTSKRGSRSSAFFRSFKTPQTETSSPELASENNVQDDSEKQVANKIRKTKSKRGSLFRSITGAKSSSGEDKLEETNTGEPSASTRDDADRPAEVVENDDSPTKAPSKHRNRLSRTATPKVEEKQREAPSKKKRFSTIGSLFGRSKDQKSSINRSKQSSQQVQRQDLAPRQGSSGHMSASVASGRANDSSDYTRDKLTREGFLAEAPGRKSSKPPEAQAPAQQQHLFPPRQQTLGSGTQQSQQRPSGWSREPSANSSITRSRRPPSQQNIAPVQHHRLHSSVTTRSTTHPSGISQSASKPQQYSSTTTTTTFTSRPPNQQRQQQQQQQQQQQSNTFPRSDSPSPPPPPPKDTWHRSKQHQHSMSNNSFTQGAGRSSTDAPFPVNIPNGPPSTNNILSLREYTFPAHTPLPQQQPGRASAQPHQSLPPLQTSIPAPAPKPHDIDPRQARQSQIETPTRAGDHSNRYATTTTTTITTASGNGGKGRAENDDEPIVMSATSFPGQMWQPQYGWDGRE